MFRGSSPPTKAANRIVSTCLFAQPSRISSSTSNLTDSTARSRRYRSCSFWMCAAASSRIATSVSLRPGVRRSTNNAAAPALESLRASEADLRSSRSNTVRANATRRLAHSSNSALRPTAIQHPSSSSRTNRRLSNPALSTAAWTSRMNSSPIKATPKPGPMADLRSRHKVPNEPISSRLTGLNPVLSGRQ